VCQPSFCVFESRSCVDPVSLGCMATQDVCQPWIMWLCVNTQSCPLYNELILVGNLGSTHLVTRLVK
jgi:hypothetical protein